MLTGAAKAPPANCVVPTLPATKFAPLRLVSPAPLPPNVPLKVTPVSLLVMTAPGNVDKGNLPVKLAAFRLVKPLPLPTKAVAVMVPAEKLPLASRVTAVLGALAVDCGRLTAPHRPLPRYCSVAVLPCAPLATAVDPLLM